MTVYKEVTIARYICDAADTKPTGVPVGSILFTRDTKQFWKCYDGTNWSVFASSSANGNLVFEKSITSSANAGDVTVATITTQPCLIKAITIHADTASQTDLTSAGIFGGASKVITFISADQAAVSYLDSADDQVSWNGEVRLAGLGNAR